LGRGEVGTGRKKGRAGGGRPGKGEFRGQKEALILGKKKRELGGKLIAAKGVVLTKNRGTSGGGAGVPG